MGIALRAALVCLLLTAPASAATFTKIADVASPGMGWSVNVFFGTPAVDEGIVAFTASDDFSRDGVFAGSGGALTTIDDASTSSSYSDPSISQGVVAFGYSEGFGTTIYTGSGGGLSMIGDDTTPDPGGSGTLTPSFAAPPAIDGANVAFRAINDNGRTGFYTSVAGTIEVSADGTTAVPGGSDLIIGGTPVLAGTEVAFTALSVPVSGVYVADGGVARVVADTNTPLPGGGGDFQAFDTGVVDIGGSSVAFDSIHGLYAEIAGVLVLISDTEVIDAVAVDGDLVAWHGNDGSVDGIWVSQGGVKQRLIASGVLLDGKLVSHFRFGAHGLDGDQLAFTAVFEDGTQGVYLATIPEPGTGALLAVGLVAAAARRRRTH